MEQADHVGVKSTATRLPRSIMNMKKKSNGNQHGVSLIAAVFIIVILAFMGLIFVSLISTGSFTAINDLQSTQAFYTAEGGVEFEQRSLAQNLDWYRGASDPLYSDTRSLGPGSFTAVTTMPATKLTRRMQTGDNTARVYSTDRFPSSGFLQIEEDLTGSGEIVQYTGKTATTFTGVTRGRTIGTVATVASPHSRGSTVYPVTTLSAGLAASCSTPATITVAQNDKLLSSGILDIEGEEIRYTAIATAGGIMTLSGLKRCLGSVGPVSHGAGQPVTPLLVGGDTADYQAAVASTGTVGSAVRAVNSTIVR